MHTEKTLAAVLAALLVLSVLPASAVPAFASTAQQTGANESSVNVTTGQQLATVLAVTSDDVRAGIETSAFQAEFDAGDESERAEAIADRADGLRERAESIREDYAATTEAYREGELTREEYARRLATLNARASNLVDAYDLLEQRAANVSKLELRAAGLNRTALEATVESVEAINGTGAAALLRRFTGQSEGEVELEIDGGLSIEVKNEDGEQSRELERPGDTSTNVTVSLSAALATARGGLSEPDGEWVSTGAKIDGDDGAYEFEFRLVDDDVTGEAEVTVDGSADRVVELEEEIEPVDDGDDGAERDEDEDADDRDVEHDEEDRELALVVTDGTVGPNGTVTVQALENGEPAANVTVRLDGEPVATTDENGTVTVTLPEGGDVELTAGEGELEFELGDDEDDDDEIRRNLSVNASLADGTVTTRVTYEANGVANATVFANGDRVGTTDDAGTVSFDVDESIEDLELEIRKGEFEAEFEFYVDNGMLVDSGEEAEDDREEDDERADDREDDEEEGDDEDEDYEDEDDDEEESEETEEDTADDDDDDDDEVEETETPE